MIPARLVKGLIQIAIEIGRWAVEKLAHRTAQWLIHYMEGRVEVFETRMARARRRGNVRREAWLAGRISRWERAIRWLRNHIAALGKSAVRAYCRGTDEALKRLPLVANCERYRRAA